MTIRVLIIEDDVDLRDSLQAYLATTGCQVRVLGDARSVDETLLAFPADIVLLDVNLPVMDGFAAAVHLRQNRPETGIIMLTGRTLRDDRLRGLTEGADHYVTKPVDPQELELLIRNLARRLPRPAAPPADEPARPVAGHWTFPTSRWVITSPAGISIALSAAEHHLLDRLTAQAGKPVPREELVADTRRPSDDALGRGLDLVVFRLRRKVEMLTDDALPVASARGIGYVFTSPVIREEDAAAGGGHGARD